MIGASSCIIGLLGSDVVCYCIPISITSSFGCLFKSVVLFPLVGLELIFSEGREGVMEFTGRFQSQLYFSVINFYGFVYMIKCSLKCNIFIVSWSILILVHVSGPTSRFRSIPRDTRGHKSQCRHGLLKIRDIHIIRIFLTLYLRCFSC